MEVLKLYIHVNGCEKVESECAAVQMISFDGRCGILASRHGSTNICVSQSVRMSRCIN